MSPEQQAVRQDVDQLSINTIRTLAIDAVQRANSGHPGAPLGMAPMGYVLWQKFLHHNPKNPEWPGRDRFVLSAGHASMLIYALLHLTGYDMPLEELKNFRQWGSKTPGHPEFFHTKGLDATTGPLGQGAAMTVGMAMAEAHLAARYNRPDFPIFDNYTYSILGDGDLQEGVNHEAASLAGHLKLGKLIWLHDDNQVQLDTATFKAVDEDTAERYRAYGWEVLRVQDGNNVTEIENAIKQARLNTDQPTLIQVRTVIGFGSPRAGTSKAHGEPLGEEGVKETKAALGWDYPPFTVPDEVKAHMDATERGAKWEADWDAMMERYRAQYPDLAAEVDALLARELPANLAEVLPSYEVGGKAIATRNASGEVINALAKVVPGLMGGSADLSGSTKTTIKDGGEFLPGNYGGRNVYFGVREFGMACAGNGLSLYGGIRPLVGTFLVFSDYLKPAFRLSAIQFQPVTYVLTHDSIGLGEDGPTHQPIGQLAMLRAVPNVHVIRPADANETAAAWQMALEYDKGPTALALSRQDLPVLPRNHAGVKKGAYVIRETDGAQVILIATGSEVSLALDAAEALAGEGIKARVVSMPCMEVFRQQDASYKASVLTPGVKRVAIEAASPMPWYEWVGLDGAVIGMTTFGASAPAKVLFEKFGFTVPNVVKVVKGVLQG
ncbi:transketolase [Deinococcus metallilatus]|uniref:Transketolase n=1 Tax=Deinococcus metallilatus TaxID=1211322 RepID=A0AAJ5K5W3_9DEIO|nr:transketolase [Deinococcus metallilatus]MBB5294419.1 transketolase [Deinococcus metallilatus]QBY10169.1 transketolase [Deinococcus metallilatus]RXJ13895.1 transketolase [Deinococcus metallilatus]TLK29861.1 transketolase [Deinococcus metallilatus]GMA15635.1 transketolase [Deinococcus metallilatus]